MYSKSNRTLHMYINVRMKFFVILIFLLFYCVGIRTNELKIGPEVIKCEYLTEIGIQY